ncbi:hypothetical protein FQN57_001957 [Myotisia sp. PD_48]|nr:hypothetical protein FQN57_001957 [Myotisia sp. PD_48]
MGSIDCDPRLAATDPQECNMCLEKLPFHIEIQRFCQDCIIKQCSTMEPFRTGEACPQVDQSRHHVDTLEQRINDITLSDITRESGSSNYMDEGGDTSDELAPADNYGSSPEENWDSTPQEIERAMGLRVLAKRMGTIFSEIGRKRIAFSRIHPQIEQLHEILIELETKLDRTLKPEAAHRPKDVLSGLVIHEFDRRRGGASGYPDVA